jgi:hypothetical protein
MSRRNFYALGLFILAIVGGYPWVLGAITGASILFLIHQIEDIIKIRINKGFFILAIVGGYPLVLGAITGVSILST